VEKELSWSEQTAEDEVFAPQLIPKVDEGTVMQLQLHLPLLQPQFKGDMTCLEIEQAPELLSDAETCDIARAHVAACT
jgi:hypothetical protein